ASLMTTKVVPQIRVIRSSRETPTATGMPAILARSRAGRAALADTRPGPPADTYRLAAARVAGRRPTHALGRRPWDAPGLLPPQAPDCAMSSVTRAWTWSGASPSLVLK